MTEFVRDTSTQGATVIRVVGEVDIATAGAFEAAVRSCLSGSNAVELDLSGMDFMDSSGLGVLVRSAQEAARVGVSLTFTEVSARTYRLFEISGLMPFFEPHLRRNESDGIAP